MNPSVLCLLLGPLALWAGLLAAPATEISGAPVLSDDNPGLSIGRPLDRREAGSSGRPKPSENPFSGSGEMIPKEPDPSANPVPSRKHPLRGKLTSLESPELAPGAAFAPKGTGAPKEENATTTPSGDQVTSGGKPLPTAQPGKPANKPASAEKVHGNPLPGKRPSPPEKPKSGGKPKPEGQPEKDSEKEEDDVPDEGDGDVDVSEDYLSSPGHKDSKEEEEDDFDRELDYGLGRSPFNPYEYHDGWSEEGSDESQPGFEEDPPSGGTVSYKAEEPALDTRGGGGAVSPPAPEPQPSGRSAGGGSAWGVADGGAAKEAPAEAPPAVRIAQ